MSWGVAGTLEAEPDAPQEVDMKAVWNGEVIAESDDTVVVEGNHYFPRAALRDDGHPRHRTDRRPARGVARH